MARENDYLEILAPAGNFDSLVAAVRCGADAVYLGSKSLNARRSAGNFDEEELARAVSYCHERDVKVYQTLNIVMFDEELGEAISAIETAARLGVDALLTQDMGIAMLARACAPALTLHASTQMSIHNLAGAQKAEELGFSRVVLAREMSREEIAKVSRGTQLETEVFVHGALCMSVSGQCYLSSMIGERSGNRGLCAQPCRLPFQAKGGVEYGLSLKDLTLADRVGELKKVGVRSLKIEGRMKRPEYVAAAVTALMAARAGEKVDFETLRSVFSRSGFTKGYFDGTLDKNMFGTREKEDVTSAKGVLGELSHLYIREQPLVPLTLKLSAKADTPMSLIAEDTAGHRVTVEGELPQVAENRPTDGERASQNLEKTGGTPYYVQETQCEIGEGLLLPASALNALRREALEEMGRLRRETQSLPFADVAVRNHPKKLSLTTPALRVRIRGEQLTDFIAQSCEKLILPLEDIPNLLRRGMVTDLGKIVAEIPRILFAGEEKITTTLLELKAQGITQAWAGNLGAIHMAQKAGLEVLGGWSLNITNSQALMAYEKIGLRDTELSFEMALPKIRQLGDYLPHGILAYGYLPLMALRNCPIKSAMGCGKCSGKEQLTDRKKMRFTISCRDRSYSELFNTVPLYLGDRIKEFQGLSFLTLYFTWESREECEELVRCYLEGRESPFPGEGKTRGLYYRSVL